MVFLASDDARHITGTELTTDGGTTANLYIVETLPTARPASAAQPESGRRGSDHSCEDSRRRCRCLISCDDGFFPTFPTGEATAMEPLRRQVLTAEMLEPGTGNVIRTPIEVRVDPLTGHSSRILPERGLMPANDFDLEALARDSQPRCPFCFGRINELTPKLLPAIQPDGRMVRGEAVLFPNLHAY